MSLGARMAAAHGPATIAQVRWHARLASALALVFLLPAVAVMDRYPWIFGPMALMFIVQAGCAIQAYRYRRRHAERNEGSGTAKAPDGAPPFDGGGPERRRHAGGEMELAHHRREAGGGADGHVGLDQRRAAPLAGDDEEPREGRRGRRRKGGC